MRAKPTKSEIDELVRNGFDKRGLPRPCSREPAFKSSIVDSKPPSSPAQAQSTSVSGTHKTSRSTPGVIVVIVIAIIVLLLLILLATTSHAEQCSIFYPEEFWVGQDIDLYPVKPPVHPKSTDKLPAPSLTNVLNRLDSLDARIDGLASEYEYDAEESLGLLRSIEFEILAISNSTANAVYAAAGTTSNSIRQASLRTYSSLSEISAGQASIIADLGVTRMFVVSALILLLVLCALLSHPEIARFVTRQCKLHRRAGVRPPVARQDNRKSFPASCETLIHLLRTAQNNPDLHIKPSVNPPGWNIGFASITGPYREENQDYGIMFGVGDRAVSIIADGVGGLPSGAEASYGAVTAAASHLFYCLGAGVDEVCLPEIVHEAMLSASHALTRRALDGNVRGLRTTLAIVVTTPGRYYAESIGDGQVVVVRKDGRVDKLVVPDRIPGRPLNELVSSLGPLVEGSANASSLAVFPGDLQIGGSDGLWNIVDDEFPGDIHSALEEYKWDLQAIADTVLKNLSEDPDAKRISCRDNVTMTLAYRNESSGGTVR